MSLLGLAAAAGWAMPSNPWLMTLAAGPLSAGLAATVVGALRLDEGDRMGLRYLVAGGAVALVLGLVSAAPVAWALGGEITGGGSAARGGGRILLGLTLALTAAGASALTVMLRRATTLPRNPSQPVATAPGSAGRHP
jgi:hypothetical protein